MGIEAEIGCTSCKKYIWLGSMKPYKWNGFQIPDKDAFRFFSLHSKNQHASCNLYYTHDAGDELPPWDENEEWQEDINSRNFWNSYSEDGKICGNCNKLLINKEGKELASYIQKNIYALFCDSTCFEEYVADYARKWDTKIYDSTNTERVKSDSKFLEIGCTHCKRYCIIDHQKDSSGIMKDYEYLHNFLTEHAFHKSLILYTETNTDISPPWKEDNNKALWKEYEY